MKITTIMAFAFVLLAGTSFALDSLFLNSMFSKTPDTIVVTNVLVNATPMCMQGIPSACVYANKTEVINGTNSTVLFPFFGKKVIEQDTGLALDDNDKYTLANFDTENLTMCGRNATSVMGIYSCAVEFYRQNKDAGANSRTTTSAFKIAFLASNLSTSQKDSDYSLMKVYMSDMATYNGHSFIALKNKNGYFALDAPWCFGDDMDRCVEATTHGFYEDSKAPFYKGYIYKTDLIY